MAIFSWSMCRNSYLWYSSESDTITQFHETNVLIESDISAIWERFQLVFHWISWKSAIFLFPVVWPTELLSLVSPPPMIIISIMFEADTTIRYLVKRFCCWYITWLLTLTLNLLTLVSVHQVWRSYACPLLSEQLWRVKLVTNYHCQCFHRHCTWPYHVTNRVTWYGHVQWTDSQGHEVYMNSYHSYQSCIRVKHGSVF